MPTLFRSSRRAEEFDRRVQERAVGTPTKRVVDDAATERLVGLAQLLRERGAADAAAVPRDAFAADLRERLMAEAATALTPGAAGLALPARTRGKRERRLVAIASAAVLLGGTAGMATAAQNALPGEALYPIKRGIEKAEVRLSMSPTGQGRDLLHQATDRLGEAQGLIEADSPTGTPQVPHTLRSFTSQAEEGSELLMSSYEDSRDPAAVATVRDFAASALRQLRAMESTAPPEARGDLRDAALALRDIDARAVLLCDTCSDLPALAMPPLFLASAEADRALRRVEAARPDNSHPVVAAKQDVRRAAVGSAAGPDRTSGGRTSTGNGTRGTVPGTGSVPGAGTVPGTGSGSGSGAVPPVPAAPKAPAPTADIPLPKLNVTPGPTPRVSVSADVDPGTITDGLGDAIETILPDPVTGGLLGQ